MNTMAKALLAARKGGSPLDELIGKAQEKLLQEEEAARAQRLAEEKELRERFAALEKARTEADLLARYEDTILATRRLGHEKLCPASLTGWRPGKPALAYGRPCRIRWGLADGKAQAAVIAYEHPQAVPGLGAAKSKLDLVPVSALTPCDCRGYIHPKACALPRRGKQEEKEE